MLSSKSSSSHYGIGMRLKKEHESTGLVVKDVLRDGPADTQGIRSGDELIQINDIHVQGLGAEEVMLLIRGPPNSTVSLSILRDSNIIKMSVPRDVEILSVGMPSPNLGPSQAERDEADKEHIRRLLSSRMPRSITNLRGSAATDYGRPLPLDPAVPVTSGGGGGGGGGGGFSPSGGVAGSRPASLGSGRDCRGGVSSKSSDPLGLYDPPPSSFAATS